MQSLHIVISLHSGIPLSGLVAPLQDQHEWFGGANKGQVSIASLVRASRSFVDSEHHSHDQNYSTDGSEHTPQKEK